MTTFLRIELAGRNREDILINLDHVVRIHPTYPSGCVIVTTDNASLNVRTSLDDLQKQMHATNGRIMIKWIGITVDAVREERILDHVLTDNARADVADWGDTDDKLRAYYGGKGIQDARQ